MKIITSRAALAHPRGPTLPDANMLELARLAAAAKVEAERVAVANQPDPDAPPALPPRNEEEAASRVAKQAAKDTAVKEAADKAAADKAAADAKAAEDAKGPE